ncbi:MAG: hypothetical protein JWP12_2208 [Bacteroidetes bacterium]|nr:hypothetical protein [Bacteroidota bacterium]
MKKIYTLLLFAFCITTGSKLQAQCALNATASRSLVCVGDTVMLNAVATAAANANSLGTTMGAGNNHRGNMFDIVAANTVTITSFDASPMANTTIAIYYKIGTFLGSESNSAAWTLVGSAAVTANALPTPTPVPVAVNITIPAGQTYAFYVTSTNTAVSLNYTDGSAVGSVYSSDANISFLQGAGMEYPFTNGGGTFTPRVWNGVIHYTVPAVAPVISYLWNTSATTSSIIPTVTANTQYTVQADATGCPTMFDTVNVAVSIPTVNAGTNVAVCTGVAVTLSASGTASYSWNNSVSDGVAFTPVYTMDYIVTGTDAIGCTGTDTVTVTVNQLPSVIAGNDTAVCTGSSIVLAGSGAATYVWDNSVTDGVAFTPAGTQTYMVTGTDVNGCVNTGNITVTVNLLPVVNAGADHFICNGSDAVLMGSGALTYSWNNGVTDGVVFIPVAGDYIVTGTDANGCASTDTVALSIDTITTTVTASATLLTAAANASYQWIDCATGTAIAGETSQTYTSAVTGNYSVYLMDLNGCTDTSGCSSVFIVTGIDNATAASNLLSVYPNPSNGSFIMKTTTTGVYTLVNELGQVLEVVKLNADNNYTMTIENLNSGIYFITGADKNTSFSKKIIVTK